MAHNLAEADAFTAAVSVADDGDACNALSVETPLQAVANRTRCLYNRAIETKGGVEPLSLGASYLNLSTRFGAALHAGAAADVPWLQTSVADAGLLTFAIPSKIGCQITEVKVRVNGRASGAAHAGAVGTMPTIALIKVDSTLGTHSHVSTVTDTTVAPATYDVMHTIAITGIAAPFADESTYYLQITGETGANSSADHFAVFSALITYAAI